MTLEKLIRIVMEAVEQVMFRQKLKVVSYAFDEKNIEAQIAWMEKINSNGKAYCRGQLPAETPDILLIDFIPLKYLSLLALGLCIDDFTSCFNQTLWAGKKVVVMKKAPMANPNTLPLAESCYQKLAGYGVTFLDGPASAAALAAKAEALPLVYSGNVLAHKDVWTHTKSGKLWIAPHVVVTQLAREEAHRLGIDIKVAERS